MQKCVLVLLSRRMSPEAVNSSYYSRLQLKLPHSSQYRNAEINAKFKSLLDLVGLYARTNRALLDKDPTQVSKKLTKLSLLLEEIQATFEILEARVKDEQGFEVGECKLVEYYAEKSYEF
jgi:hypothetical protein